MTDVRSKWSGDDYESLFRRGYRIVAWRIYKTGDRTATSVNDLEENFRHILAEAMMGDPTCYKAIRIVVKNNSWYKEYKKTVRAIYRTFHRGEK